MHDCFTSCDRSCIDITRMGASQKASGVWFSDSTAFFTPGRPPDFLTARPPDRPPDSPPARSVRPPGRPSGRPFDQPPTARTPNRSVGASGRSIVRPPGCPSDRPTCRRTAPPFEGTAGWPTESQSDTPDRLTVP